MCATLNKIQFARLLSQIPGILTEGSLESRENRQQWYDKSERVLGIEWTEGGKCK